MDQGAGYLLALRAGTEDGGTGVGRVGTWRVVHRGVVRRKTRQARNNKQLVADSSSSSRVQNHLRVAIELDSLENVSGVARRPWTGPSNQYQARPVGQSAPWLAGIAYGTFPSCASFECQAICSNGSTHPLWGLE